MTNRERLVVSNLDLNFTPCQEGDMFVNLEKARTSKFDLITYSIGDNPPIHQSSSYFQRELSFYAQKLVVQLRPEKKTRTTVGQL